jgi:hypothetical protein
LWVICVLINVNACHARDLNPFDRVQGSFRPGQLSPEFLIVGTNKIGQSKLGRIADFFGVSVSSIGRSPSPIAYVCIRSIEDNLEVHFESGAMGGWSSLTSVIFSRPNFYPKRKCETSSIDFFKELHDIRLGIDQNKFKEMLGQIPTFQNDFRIELCFEKTILRDVDGRELKGAINTGIIGVFSDNHLEAYTVFGTESY